MAIIVSVQLRCRMLAAIVVSAIALLYVGDYCVECGGGDSIVVSSYVVLYIDMVRTIRPVANRK